VARITDQGLLVEPARTNYALRNTAIDPVTYGAIWATSNLTAAAPTITYGTADVMAPDGTQTATKAVFPAVAANQVSNLYQLFTGTAAAWSGDFWIRTASGTATVYAWFAANTGSVLAGSYATCDVTTTWTRCGPQNVTLSAASYLLRVGYDARAASGNTPTGAGGTVYVWGATAEIGSYRTSTIVVAGTATARNADQVSATVPVQPPNWCLAATGTPLSGNVWGSDWLAAYYTGVAGYTIIGGVESSVWDSTPAQKKLTYTRPSSATHRAILCGTSAGAISLSIDGTSTGSVSGVGTGIPKPLTSFSLGWDRNGAAYFGGFIKDVRIYKVSKPKDAR
jgi:hypothetical protein